MVVLIGCLGVFIQGQQGNFILCKASSTLVIQAPEKTGSMREKTLTFTSGTFGSW